MPSTKTLMLNIENGCRPRQSECQLVTAPKKMPGEVRKQTFVQLIKFGG